MSDARNSARSFYCSSAVVAVQAQAINTSQSLRLKQLFRSVLELKKKMILEKRVPVLKQRLQYMPALVFK